MMDKNEKLILSYFLRYPSCLTKHSMTGCWRMVVVITSIMTLTKKLRGISKVGILRWLKTIIMANNGGYVSRQAAIAAIHELKMSVGGYDNDALDVSLIYEALGEIPDADVQPIKFGKWKMAFETHRLNRAICSCCNWSTDEYGAKSYNFCPNCVAKMESEE